jgi:ankyrin repeat protein
MSGEWLYKMDGHGHTPLDRAFNSGHMALAEIMLQQHKEDQNAADSGDTPMHRAAHLGLSEAVKSLLQYGADPSARDRHGETTLHKAVREGCERIVEMLVDRCDVNARCNLGMTPLHWACLNGHAGIVRLLLSHGADPNLANDTVDGLTPTEIAGIMEYDEVCVCFKMHENYV